MSLPIVSQTHTHTFALQSTTAGQEWVCACGKREPVNPPQSSTSATPDAGGPRG